MPHFYHIVIKPWVFIFLCLIILFSCKKTDPKLISSENSMHVFAQKYNQSSWFISQTPDNGFSIVGTEDLFPGSDDAYFLHIIKTNESGKIEWQQKRENIRMPFPLFTHLKDGNVLFSSSYGTGGLGKMKENGELEFIHPDYSTDFMGSYPIAVKSGGFAVPYSNGWHVHPSINKIATYDETGNKTGNISIQDTALGIKILYFGINRCDSIGDYYINGWCYPNWTGSWLVNKKLFVAHIKYNGNKLIYKKINILDPSNETNKNLDLYQFYTRDNHLMMLVTQQDSSKFFTSISKTKLLKIDINQNIVWEKYLPAGTKGNYGTSVTECTDGNYLVCGSCNVTGKSAYQPFSCKTSKSGDILWTQIYSTPLSSWFNWGSEMSNGGLIFTGITNGFGKGLLEQDIFFIKTDKNGHFK